MGMWFSLQYLSFIDGMKVKKRKWFIHKAHKSLNLICLSSWPQVLNSSHEPSLQNDRRIIQICIKERMVNVLFFCCYDNILWSKAIYGRLDFGLQFQRVRVHDCQKGVGAGGRSRKVSNHISFSWEAEKAGREWDKALKLQACLQWCTFFIKAVPQC